MRAGELSWLISRKRQETGQVEEIGRLVSQTAHGRDRK